MTTRLFRSENGQSLLEFAIVLPMVVVLALGVVEAGYALLDAHVVTRLAREGSNLISRDASLQDAVAAMRGMASRPVDFDNGSKVILSVIKTVDTIGAANYNQPVLYERYEYGSLSAQSALTTAGTGSFGAAPDYKAANSDNDANLRVTNLPANLAVTLGGMIYVTEVYSPHTLLTPVDRFGITMPQTLYSIAYF